MNITLNIPDQVWTEDPSYQKYFELLQQMVNRLAMSHYKYGPIEDNAVIGEVDEMLSGRKRLWMYDGIGPEAEGKKGNTGNVENLLDAANFFLIETMFPKHVKSHFKAQTSEQSPGLTRVEC